MVGSLSLIPTVLIWPALGMVVLYYGLSLVLGRKQFIQRVIQRGKTIEYADSALPVILGRIAIALAPFVLFLVLWVANELSG